MTGTPSLPPPLPRRLQDGIYGDSKYCTSFKAHSVGQKSIVVKGPRKKLDSTVHTTEWTSESMNTIADIGRYQSDLHS